MQSDKCFLINFTVLFSIVLSVSGLGQLSIDFCTPENSECLLASDGKPETCFLAKSIYENNYFAVFKTGKPLTVDKIRLNVGKRRTQRTTYTVTLGGGAYSNDLNCTMSADAQTIDCPAGRSNITSMMIRSEPLVTRLNLIEVVAFNRNGAKVQFSSCDAMEVAANCSLAMDHNMTTTVVTEATQFPSWFGSMEVPDSISQVKIYRAKPKPDDATSIFRVFTPNSRDCKQVASQTKEETNGVEVLEFQCSGMLDSSLRVWEFSDDYLINLCEIEVSGG